MEDSLLGDVLEAAPAGKLSALTREHAADDELNTPSGLDRWSLNVLLFYFGWSLDI